MKEIAINGKDLKKKKQISIDEMLFKDINKLFSWNKVKKDLNKRKII